VKGVQSAAQFSLTIDVLWPFSINVGKRILRSAIQLKRLGMRRGASGEEKYP
jgi:hypothetical protein